MHARNSGRTRRPGSLGGRQVRTAPDLRAATLDYVGRSGETLTPPGAGAARTRSAPRSQAFAPATPRVLQGVSMSRLGDKQRQGQRSERRGDRLRHPSADAGFGRLLVRCCLLGSCFASTVACVGSSCDPDGQEPQWYSGGRTNESQSAYETSTFEGPFLYFPSGRVYRLEHGLREAPSDYAVYLSFAERPLDKHAGFAESAGNQAMVEDLNEEYIEVRNDTCAEFFLRLTARIAPFDEASDGAMATPLPDAASDADSGAM